MKTSFRKVLSANDVGLTKSHQAGMLIPKSNSELRDFLGALDPSVKNPRQRVICLDQSGAFYELNFIYYNNKLHEKEGTRNEYRLTGLRGFIRKYDARPGDEIEISKDNNANYFSISIFHRELRQNDAFRIVLSGWRRVC